jgi:hypothetical protein
MKRELLADLMAWLGQPHVGVATGAGKASPLMAGDDGEEVTAESVDRGQRRAEILEQPIPMPQAQAGMVAPLAATQAAAVGNLVKALMANRQRKRNDARSRHLLARELGMQQAQRPDDPSRLDAVIPPSLRGIGPREAIDGAGERDARRSQRNAQRAQEAGVDSYLSATFATNAANGSGPTEHDLAALRSGGLEGALAAQRFFPGEPERIDLGDRIGLFRNGKEVGSIPKGASPDAAANRAAADARAREQREHADAQAAAQRAHTAEQAELTRGQQRDLANEQRALTERGQDFTQQRAAVDDARLQDEVDRKLAESENEKAVKYQAAIDQFEQGMSLLDRLASPDENGELVVHPGFAGAVGAKGPSSLFGVLEKPISGTDAADFTALVEQLGGRQFLEAFASLRGSGQISNVEGTKAEQAIMNLSRSQSEPQFLENLGILRDIMSGTLERERMRAGAPAENRGANAELSDVSDADLLNALGL